jgi:hypothetical protein
LVYDRSVGNSFAAQHCFGVRWGRGASGQEGNGDTDEREADSPIAKVSANAGKN